MAIRMRKSNRRGAVTVKMALMMIPLLGIVAFGLDYGYLLKIRTDLQRAADSGALAGAQELLPAADGSQDMDAVRARVREYVQENLDSSFVVPDSDIEIGAYDRDKIYSQVAFANSGQSDTVRVTLRRSSQANSPVSLFLAPVLGIHSAEITVIATAVLQKSSQLTVGDSVLPFAVHQDHWDAMQVGDQWSILGDGKVKDENGDEVPGNWGTVDIGAENNSTSDLRDQILNGLLDEILEALHDDGRILNEIYIDAAQPIWLQADPGLSSGMKSAVELIHGAMRIIPIYDQLSGQLNGDNLEFRIVKWGVVTVVDSQWGGSNNTYVKVKKSYLFDGKLIPHSDLSNSSGVIEGAFTSPGLVE